MSTFLNAPCCWSSDSTDAENQIREIFFQHWGKMKDRMVATVNEINTWRQNLIEYTNKYADEQIRNLVDDYDRQRPNLAGTCEENLDTARACYSAQNVELFNELSNACRLLEFQVAQLEFATGTITVPKVITVQEQMERKKNELSHASKPEANKSEEKLIIEHTNDIHDNRSENRDVPVKSVSSISNETPSPHSSAFQSSKENSRSINNNNGSQAHTMNGDDPINKCPICFMIFPLTMTQDNRSQHVNEHCTDD